MARFALPTQLTFLFQRADQLRGLAQLDLFRRPTVADFLLDKDPLFARLNLSDDEYALYEKVYAHLKPQTPTPDLVIYLQAPVATLIERVHRRGVDFERAIPAEYLARLADAYTRYFYRYEEAPLLIVNSERLNFVDNPRHVDLLLERVAGMRGAARVLQPWLRLTSPPARRLRGRRGARRAPHRAWRCRRWRATAAHRDADLLRRKLRRAVRGGRRRRAAGRRLARHGDPGARLDACR